MDQTIETPKNNLIKDYSRLLDIHNEILDMYNNYIYEDWNNAKKEKFSSLIDESRKLINEVNNLVDKIQWNSYQNKENYLRLFRIFEKDNEIYECIRIRHKYFPQFAAKKISIIADINEANGFVKDSTKEIYNLDIFNYYLNSFYNYSLNEISNKIDKGTIYNELKKQYTNLSLKEIIKKRDALLNKEEELYNEDNLYYIVNPNFYKNNVEPKVKKYFNQQIYNKEISNETLYEIWKKYVLCRAIAIDIFDGICSTDPQNGWKEYGYRYIKYFYGDANLREIRKLSQIYGEKTRVLSEGESAEESLGLTHLQYGEKMDKKLEAKNEARKYRFLKKINESLNLKNKIKILDIKIIN